MEACRGAGACVAVAPAGPGPHHHFYAGTRRPPRHSFLGALLDWLGGGTPTRSRRYDEIVVCTAGVGWDEAGRDKPDEEVFRRARQDGTTENWGEAWSTRWFRGAPPPPAREPGDRPNPLDPGGAADRFAARWLPRPVLETADFPTQLPCTESGLEFPARLEALRAIVEALETRAHPTLLLVELSVLDYPDPTRAPADQARLSEVGVSALQWLPRWVNERGASTLDVVFYSRNPTRRDALFGGGLPRPPDGHTGAWPSVRYRGRNLIRLDFPNGAFPFEARFAGDPGFAPTDGTADDTPEARRTWSDRTLQALLTGRGVAGPVRLKLGAVPPAPPARPPGVDRLSRAFWAEVDPDAVLDSLGDSYFGAREMAPVKRLTAAMARMREEARRARSDEDFHVEVEDEWKRASRILLWGGGGQGKSLLGRQIGRLLYGADAHVVRCNELHSQHDDPSAGFKAHVFGPPPGYLGSETPTATTAHLQRTGGFTVLVFDEVNRIAPDFRACMEVLYALLEDRSFLPQNPAVTGGRALSLWNTVIVLTANLDRFPPTGVAPEAQEAMKRRVSDYAFPALDDARLGAFARWWLVGAVRRALGDAARCHAGDLPELGPMRARNFDSLAGELEPIARTAIAAMARDGLRTQTAPSLLDVTPWLREACLATARAR